MPRTIRWPPSCGCSTRLTGDATADIGHVLDHPDPDDDILSVCDRLLTSLDAAERNAFEMIELLERMKKLA